MTQQFTMPEFDFDEKNDFTDEELAIAALPPQRIQPGERTTLKILSAKWNGPASDPTWHKINMILGLPDWTIEFDGEGKATVKDEHGKRTTAMYHTLTVPTKNMGFQKPGDSDSSPNTFMSFCKFMLGLGFDVDPANFRERFRDIFDERLTKFVGKTLDAVPGYQGNYYDFGEDKICRIVDVNGKPIKIKDKTGKEVANEFRNRQEAYAYALQYKVRVDENPMMRLIVIFPGQDSAAEPTPAKKKFDD